jgi:hypothetical protein
MKFVTIIKLFPPSQEVEGHLDPQMIYAIAVGWMTTCGSSSIPVGK